MRLAAIQLAGLGDCGTSPCGFTDLFWVSTDCAQYQACLAAPTVAAAVNAMTPAPTMSNLPASQIYANPLYSALPSAPSAGDLAAQAAGAAPGTAFSSMTAAQQAAFLAAIPSPPSTPDLPTWLPWAAGGFVLLILLMSMGGRRR